MLNDALVWSLAIMHCILYIRLSSLGSQIFIIPTTSTKSEGHIAFGFVHPSICLSVDHT